MPWKHLKDSPLRLPSRQDLLIIGGTAFISILVIVYFMLKS